MMLPAHEVGATPRTTDINHSKAPGSIRKTDLTSGRRPADAGVVCPPRTDSLYSYDYGSYVKVTNDGGSYDSGTYFKYDYTRGCQVSPITSVLIRDNFGVTEQESDAYFRYEFTYRDISNSNCWEIARVSAYGQSDWSNKVCYTAPVIQPVSISGIYMYLNANGQLDGDVYIKWTKGSDSAGLRWTACPTSDTWQPSDPNWTYDQTSYSTSGQTVFSRHISNGPRCKLVSTKNRNGILSTPFRVEYTFNKRMAQPYSSSPNYVTPYSSKNRFGPSGGYSKSSSNNCVGICYGVPSKVNGLPRNTYVSGYFRKDGTYVRPYTRSK